MTDRRPDMRALTAGETALAASVFGDALDAGRVAVRCAKYWALHPWWVTMAPDGHIWCHPQGFNWCVDYSDQPLGMRAHFIHELVHCWQVQQGFNLLLRRLPLARYRYVLAPGKPFARYGIEQQATMVEHAYLARQRRQADVLAQLGPVLPFAGWQ
ncbi:vgr related protein [Sandarakinorhabdus sp.]|uniref:vgr related protein n=1 Tax=Sandarakinorhabdus sp. TaxID=1916663 RepID=UPI00286E9BF3|nr:vgr related protein [Sandarakinorhabdus sp.]